MRTTTATFRNRVFKQVRALGINHARSVEVTRSLVYTIRRQFNDADIATLEMELDIFGSQHLVRATVNGSIQVVASNADRTLVNIEPTARQIALCEEMRTLSSAIYDLLAGEYARPRLANGEIDWDGALIEIRPELGHDAPEVKALNARYDTLRAESLAINPWASGSYIDPDLAGFYSDIYKDECGFRPRGYISYRAMDAYVKAACKASNDDNATALAI